MFFTDKYAFLSNFFNSPIEVDVAGQKVTVTTVEHGFQMAKTNNISQKMCISYASLPARAKKLGRKATLRPDWDEIKLDVMEKLLRQKFSDPVLMGMLVDIEGEIIEHNRWHDNYWGKCVCQQCRFRYPDGAENHLGKLLMQLRDEYISYLSSLDDPPSERPEQGYFGYDGHPISMMTEREKWLRGIN